MPMAHCQSYVNTCRIHAHCVYSLLCYWLSSDQAISVRPIIVISIATIVIGLPIVYIAICFGYEVLIEISIEILTN